MGQRWDRQAAKLLVDSPAVDAFGRQRVGNPLTLFSSTVIHDAQPGDWDDQEVSGSGTTSAHVTNTASVLMTTTALTAGARTRRTRRRFVYQPGKSQQVLMTGVLGSRDQGTITRIGAFDSENGVYFELRDGVLGVTLRSNVTGSVVDTFVPQSDWNLNTLDGNQGSTVIDTEKTQIFEVDYQWLGVGRVRFGLDIDGVLTYVHEIRNANNLQTAYMSTPTLPLCYEIESDGTNAAGGVMTAICSAVVTEGGLEDRGPIETAVTGADAVNANTSGTAYAMIGIRLRGDRIDAALNFEAFTFLATTNDDFLWELRANPVVAGTFTYANAQFTNAQIAIGDVVTSPDSTNTVTGGFTLFAGYTRAEQPVTELPRIAAPLGSLIDGTLDEIVLCVTPLTNGLDAFASLSWRELQ